MEGKLENKTTSNQSSPVSKPPSSYRKEENALETKNIDVKESKRVRDDNENLMKSSIPKKRRQKPN